ncbi:Chondroitin N-acetylgalactosaminyltransferase [Cordyceps fumosorosea ARSEF 2679]|uniref:Chondroitin N-acetylgalactosaminyltransferase n=1 Tax=Cordyceps fumosorosea (strain ARSEF 2679) TaxID=1081104 RepID=A0A167MS79_CORFA|nr:Chondroitin N-acetylgalactosaminyltransferase [Cordyceps fumosorosea ARSEF 2679]OAA54696.1 Chondroitin N-acetylgalactosaminyltransferase [Cordyceps fumosorosea ARSEF 2679]
MVPVGKLLASVPFHKNFRRNFLFTLFALAFVALLQIHYNGSPLRLRPAKPKPYHIATIEDDDEPRTMVTSSTFHPVAFPTSEGKKNKSLEELCASFPRHLLATIQPVLKTGFTDDPERMQSQMESCSACFQPSDLLIFSDLDDTYEGHEVIDVLAALPKSYHDYEQFKPYFEQKRLRDSGAASRNPAALKAIDGWKLDKFKFLPQVEMAWQMRPNRDFYVFYETDTYVFWDPLLRFLNTLDPDTPLYMGSASPGRQDEFGRDTLFANGGPGYVLSRATVKRLLHRRASPTGFYLDPPFAEKHHGLMHDLECCGDSALGFAIWQSGIQMSALYPMFAQHALQNLPYDAMRWCSPLLTMHKPNFDDMRAVFQWEFTTRSNDYAMRHRDLWGFQKPGKESRRDNWRNDGRGSRRVEGEDVAIATQEECEAHCQSLPECLMWTWRGHDRADCLVSEGIVRVGEAAAPETTADGQANYTAGWLTERVDEWRSTHECNDTLWLSHSFGRMF